MAQQATSRTIDVVTSIWQHVLNKQSIGADDNFFEIGGTPSAAGEVSCEIERRLGRAMSPVMLYHTPTITSLTTALQNPNSPAIPPLTLLKPGPPRAPLFIAHGVGGNVLEFFDLVERLGTERAIYGMQAKGSDGTSEPLDRIEDMAAFHLAAIRQVQPRGPFFLVGHSLGGLVVLEIARLIMQDGDNPGLAVMVDSYPHLRHLAPAQQARLIARLAARRVFGSKTHFAGPADNPEETTTKRPESPCGLKAATRRVRECGYIALERYRPRFYNGKVHFIRAEIVSVFPDDPTAVWNQYAKEFELETVPGDHFGMLTTHVDKLAAILARYSRELHE